MKKKGKKCVHCLSFQQNRCINLTLQQFSYPSTKVSSTATRIWNWSLILKTYRMSSVHTTPEEFKNATFTCHFELVFEENLVRKISCLSWCMPLFSWQRISVNGRLNRRNKPSFSHLRYTRSAVLRWNSQEYRPSDWHCIVEIRLPHQLLDVVLCFCFTHKV